MVGLANALADHVATGIWRIDMAIVRALVQGHQNVRAHPTMVDGYVQVLDGDDGRPLVHVSTWGSDNRQTVKKQSQVLQFDEASAAQLVRYFVVAFGDRVLP